MAFLQPGICQQRREPGEDLQRRYLYLHDPASPAKYQSSLIWILNKDRIRLPRMIICEVLP